jgi:outer membrane protein OmpA-like peptidoglycan-associated protein
MWLNLVLATLIALASFSAQAAPIRADTVQVLDSLSSNWPEANLRAWVNDGEEQIPLGSQIVYHFQAEKDAYLTVLYVDTEGSGTLLFPSGIGSDNRLRAGVERTFPGELEDLSLSATGPQGAEAVYVIAAKREISPAELGVSVSPGQMESLDEAATLAFAQRLRDVVGGMPAGSVAIARIDQQITARVEHTAEKITRSIHRQKAEDPLVNPEIPFHLGFEYGSSALAPDAKVQLDELGKAMKASPEQFQQIKLEGHTCDIGTEEHNRQLSRDRAEAAKSYLVNNWEIAPSTVTAVGLGESEPATPGTSDAARRDNRRVVLEVMTAP